MNRIQAMLDDWGVPWRSSRSELASRFGVQTCPWSEMDVLCVPGDKDGLPSLLRPLSYWVDDRQDPDFPPLSLSGSLWCSDDALGNLAIARTAIEAHLGPGQPYDSSNTKGRRWQDGAASVRIIGWPPKLQRDFGPNRWHQREPRLKTACSIEIETGFRIACSSEELSWLAAFIPAVDLPVAPLSDGSREPTVEKSWIRRLMGQRPATPPLNAVESMAALAVSPAEQAYVRLPPPDVARLHGRAGLSPDGAVLILCAGQLKMVPLTHILRVHLEKIAPAKGGGGQYVELIIQRDANAPTTTCSVVQVSASQSLDALAEALAALIDRPLTIGHSSDC